MTPRRRSPSAAKVHKAEFRSDYGYHAQMEPLNAVARFNDAGDRVEIWEGTQAPDISRTAVAKALGFKEEQVEHHQCYLGGGFGRRNGGYEAVEAAQIARAVKRPVKLIWTRTEDLAQGRFRPQSFQCLEAATDASGKVTGWKHCVIGDGGNMLLTGGMRIAYYGVPNQSLELRGISHGVQIKHWRAVAHVFNVFAIESFIDQMAVDANMDPIAFRFERMGATPKARAVLRAGGAHVRLEGGASGTAAPSALSISERSGSLGAGVVEISLDRQSGKIKVHKVWVAIDGGTIVSPGPAKANIESAILYGLSSVLHERVTLKDGAVEQTNFHDYNLMRMSDLPDEMHVSVRRRRHPADRPRRDRQSVHRRRDLQCVPPAHRQAAAPPAVHAGARAGDAARLSAGQVNKRARRYGGRFALRSRGRSRQHHLMVQRSCEGSL